MQDARKPFSSYTVTMLKRLGLLAIPTVVFGFLGVSMVLAQQGSPSGNLTEVAPQATPMEGTRGGPTPPTPTATPVPPTVTATPAFRTPNEVPPTNPNATPTPTSAAPTATPATGAQQPVPTGAAYLAANIPPNLMPVAEAKQQPSPPSAAAMAAIVDPALRPVPEQPALPSFQVIPMVGGESPRASEVPQPPSAPVPLNIASSNLIPVKETNVQVPEVPLPNLPMTREP